MLTAVNLLRGYCVVEMEGRFPERLLNISARSGVEFWKLERLDERRFRARVRRRSLARLGELAARTDCTLRVERRRGAPFVIRRLLTRYALMASLAVCLAGVAFMTSRVWQMEVTGNSDVSAERILRELQALGIGVGCRRSEVQPELLEDIMLLRVPELSWFALNLSGSRATAEVRERTRPPELLDETRPANVVAARDCVLDGLFVLEGQAAVKTGDAVLTGELIVSGVTETATGARLVRARAEAWGLTQREISAAVPMEILEKRAAGGDRTKYALIFAGKRINLFFSSSISPAGCDKIIERKPLRLGEWIELPIVLERTVLTPYEASPDSVSRQRAEEALSGLLASRLPGGKDARLVGSSVEYREKGGLLVATLTAEYRERVDVEADIPLGDILK